MTHEMQIVLTIEGDLHLYARCECGWAGDYQRGDPALARSAATAEYAEHLEAA